MACVSVVLHCSPRGHLTITACSLLLWKVVVGGRGSEMSAAWENWGEGQAQDLCLCVFLTRVFHCI